MKRAVLLLLTATCSPSPPVAVAPLARSSTLALSDDGATLYVVNPDADSISLIDLRRRALTREVLLAPEPPRVDGAGDYVPAVAPVSIALGGGRVFAVGRRSGRVYALDPSGGRLGDAAVCAEPAGVLASADGSSLYVTCAQDDVVVALDAATLAERSRVAVGRRPWALAQDARGRLLVTHLLGPGVTVLSTSPLAVAALWPLADGPAGRSPTAPHGPARSLYGVAVRPGTDEVWVAHALHGHDTPQPTLDFQSTVFPAISVFGGDGAARARMSVRVDGEGAFADVTSGPHAIAFTADGASALVVDAHSEDVLVVDARGRFERSLLRPLPGHQPEGLVLSADGHAYVDERNTGDVVVLRLEAGGSLAIDGAPIPRLERDPMPPALRLGQHLFHSANSDEAPITRNHWVACASCHVEGRSDAITWRFAQGPRDTPSNAGGTRGTGFLFRTADRRRVQDYWHTINVEQGGRFDPAVPPFAAYLDALAAYVDHALPLPVPPRSDPARVARGEALFLRPDVGCADCHAGPRRTDSGAGNPGLDLGGVVRLHDVGTCAAGDVDHADMDGHPRLACRFDTPSLDGLADTAPYLHDGSAATLREVLERTAGRMGDARSLTDAERDDLVAYLRSR